MVLENNITKRVAILLFFPPKRFASKIAKITLFMIFVFRASGVRLRGTPENETRGGRMAFASTRGARGR